MEQQSQTQMPKLSVVVPSTPKATAGPLDKTSQRLSQMSNESTGNVPAKQKRLFPVACRLVPMDQWFTTRVDRTWNVLDLKIWLLSKALPSPVLPLPASYRPSSPVTFAAAPPPPPRPSSETSSLALSSSTTLVSPITLAATDSHLSTSISHNSPQTPGGQVTYPLSPAPDTPSSPVSSTVTSASPVVLSRDDEDVHLYANSYGAILNSYFDDEDDDDNGGKVVRIAAHSISYSYKTGTPAISGLGALKSNSSNIISGRGYSGSHSTVDMDLVRQQAMAIANRWHIYSFSTGMLLSDQLPLAEYTIRPYELLELHRAGAYVSLPRTIVRGLDPYSSSDDREISNPLHPSVKTVAYPSSLSQHPNPHSPIPTQHSFYHHTQTDGRDAVSSESSDDEFDGVPSGSPYTQPYFDGWVWVLRDGASGPSGNIESGTHIVGDGDGLSARKMRHRGRAKSEAAKSGRGKDRARMEREWKDLKQQLRKEGDVEVELQESTSQWNKRWLVIREGIMTLWKERGDDSPEGCYKIASCVGLYGADRLQSILAATSKGPTPFPTPVTNAHPPHASTPTSSSSSPYLSPYVICARFRQRSSLKSTQPGRHGKSSGKSHQRTGTWVVLKVPDMAIHEHLLRIFHRLSYSSPVSSNHSANFRCSGLSSRTLQTRTLRTDFVPNPIPHPLSLSFSAPSPIQQGDASPISSFDDRRRSESSEYDDEWIETGSAWGHSRQKAAGKSVASYVGLGDGVGVRYPEWREEIIYKAIHAGRGISVPESRGSPDSSSQVETLSTDQLHTYGLREDLDNYAVNVGRDDYYSDDSDSDAFSEAEWAGWAYDLDRPKVVDEIRTKPGGKPSRTGPIQGGPVTEPELAVVPDSSLDGASLSTSTLSPRAQNFRNNNSISPVQINISPPPTPTSASPTTPSARVRASTISVHPDNSSSTVVQTSMGVSQLAAFSSSQVDRGLRPDVATTLRGVEPNTTGAVRSIMRGFNIRAGKESFLRGLENALDFVEGK